MTDETKKPEGDLGAEMEALARQLGATLRAAWYSQERRDVQVEIETGLHDMSTSLAQMAQEIKATPAAQRVKQKATVYHEQAKQGELGQKVQVDLATGLRALSEQLRALAEGWTPLDADAIPVTEQKPPDAAPESEPKPPAEQVPISQQAAPLREVRPVAGFEL